MSTQDRNATSKSNPLSEFGPNEWIVEDMYQRYLADPSSVESTWHEFFDGYQPHSADTAAAAETKTEAKPQSAPKTAETADAKPAAKPVGTERV